MSVRNVARSFGCFPVKLGLFIQKQVLTTRFAPRASANKKTRSHWNCMYEYLLSIKDQAGFLITSVKFFIYFCIGALLIFLTRKLIKIFQFFFYKFNKDFFLEKLNFFFNLIIFISISTIIGWALILLITNKIF